MATHGRHDPLEALILRLSNADLVADHSSLGPAPGSSEGKGVSMPVISVIIPVWNGEHEIGTCLQALGCQDCDQNLFEVIVVDNGSTDKTRDVVKGIGGVILLEEPIASSYLARNRGIAHARGEYLLFTDADCIPGRHWVSAALAISRGPRGSGIHGGPVSTFLSTSGSAACAAFDQIFAFNQERNILRDRKCVTANFLCSRAMMDDIGGFAGHLKSGGDVECSRRALARGYTLEFAPEMEVSHPARATVGQLVAKQRRVVGGRWQRDNKQLRDLPRFLANLAIEHAAQFRRALISRVSFSLRIGVALIVVQLWAWASFEAIRVAAGGEARRA